MNFDSEQPTPVSFQVAVALGLCIYFLNDRLKSIGRATTIGYAVFLRFSSCPKLRVLIQSSVLVVLLTILVLAGSVPSLLGGCAGRFWFLLFPVPSI